MKEEKTGNEEPQTMGECLESKEKEEAQKWAKRYRLVDENGDVVSQGALNRLMHNERSAASRLATCLHMKQVHLNMNRAIEQLLLRAVSHDASKLEEPEAEVFAEATACLKGLTYESDEYREQLKKMKPALDHHYAENRHHPEHHENGINDMTLIDLIEMLCDWEAATKRHADGDIWRSIEHNRERFGISEQLVQILKNTVLAILT